MAFVSEQHNRLNTSHAVVIGAGVSGLSAATVLGRSGIRSTVISEGPARNSAASGIHNFPAAEGIEPARFYSQVSQDVAGYGVEFVAERVISVQASEKSIAVITREDREIQADYLLLATGLQDRLPEWVPSQLWGKQIFTCPFCHAHEFRGRDFAVVGPTVITVESALLCAPNARSLTVIVGDPAAAESLAAKQLAEIGGRIIVGTVSSVSKTEESSVTIVTDAGEAVVSDAVLLTPSRKPSNDLAEQLELSLTPQGLPVTDFTGLTSNPRVWAAGNAAQSYYLFAEAMASGTRAGMSIVKSAILGH